MSLVRHYRFSVQDYERLHAVGILTDRHDVELLEGRVAAQPAYGARHAAWLRGLIRQLAPALGDDVVLSVRDPLRAPGSELRPDLMLLRHGERLYADGHPGPADVLLIVEVAELSLAYDRLVKIPLYGRIGVDEAWVVDLDGETVWAYRDPGVGGGYAVTLEWPFGVPMEPQALPGLTLDGSAPWGERDREG